jgi:uroporphyrinogen-III synthase
MAADIVNVVLTREAGKNDELLAWLPPEATVSEVPLTTTLYFDPDDVAASLERSRANGTYRTLVVTSARSAAYVELALSVTTPDVEVYCVGPTTSSAVVARGLSVHVLGEGSAIEFAPQIARGPVLLLGAALMRDELATALRAKGLVVVNVACYETVGLTLDASDIETLRGADVLFIGAPSAWMVARQHVGSATWVVVPGTSTGAVVRDDHPRVIEGWGPELLAQLETLSA